MSGSILVEDDGPVRVVTIDRPEKRNALTVPMLADLELAFDIPGSVRAVAVVGAGKSFCAGFDLKRSTLGNTDDAVFETLKGQLRGLSACVRAMRACPAPIALGAHGAAVAGGAALLAGADVVISHAEAKIGYPVLRLGISPAVNGAFLRASVGGGARTLTLDPTLVSGARAHALGMVHEMAEDADAVRTRTLDIARTIASKPAPGVRATKKLLASLDGVAPPDPDRGLAASEGALDDDTIERLAREIWNR